MIRITRIRYGFWRFLSDAAVLNFNRDFNKIYGEIIFNDIMSLSENFTKLYSIME